jgi:hypothetical protein
MAEMDEYLYGCLMWTRSLSRYDDSKKPYSEDEKLHFKNIVLRLRKLKHFDQKTFENDARLILQNIRKSFEIYCPQFLQEEDGHSEYDELGDYHHEQAIINHLLYCTFHFRIFDELNAEASKNKIDAITNIMLPKYAMDTTVGIINFTNQSIPWRSEHVLKYLFQNANEVMKAQNKWALFGASKADKYYAETMTDLSYLIKELKFEGIILDRMSIEQICEQIFIRCGVMELAIKTETNDRAVIETCNGAMQFILTFFGDKALSHERIKQILADAS